MNKRNIWMDCDPGIDDAVAIAMAAASQDRLNICGISTVSGNQTGERVTDNALKLAAFTGLTEVPVVEGARGPLVRKARIAEHIHGKTGLGNYEVPGTSKKVISENAVLYMKNIIMELPENEKITLLPTAPLTNIALLFMLFPEVKGKIEEIVLMGGSSAGGNVTPEAEFNIWADPEAAEVVFSSGLPIVMCGLDVTLKCGLSHEQIETLKRSENAVRNGYGEMLAFYADRRCGQVAIHDAVTVLYLTNPELFNGVYVHVKVDCSEENRGMTVCKENGSVYMLNEVDAFEFQKVLLEKLNYF